MAARHGNWVGLGLWVLLSSAPATAADPSVATPSFEITRFAIEGNSLLTEQEVAERTSAFTGKGRTFADVQLALDSLQQAYRERGWGAVSVILPEQELKDGVVRLRVVEGRIRKVTIAGAQHRDDANTRRAVPALQEGQTPNLDALARNLQLANENPTRQLAVTMRTGQQEGDVEADVEVTDRNPSRFFLSADNSGTNETGRYRVGAGYQHANLFDRDHVATVQWITSPEEMSDVNIFGAGYRIPIYAWDGMFDVFAGYSDVDSGTVQGLFNVSGKGTVAGARYTQFLKRLGTGFEHRLSAGLDWRKFDNDLQLVGGSAQLLPDYTVRPVSLTYSGTWRQAQTRVGFYGGFYQNISGGSNGGDADFNAVRFGADADYNLWRYGFDGAVDVYRDWQARVNFMGQYTDDLLVPGEQFGIGGANSVRGFLERELSNDRGYSAQFEVYTPNFAPLLNAADWQIRALTFYDMGYNRRNDPLPGEIARESISSAGLGIRLGYGDLNIRFDWARVLQPGGTQGNNDDRIHAAVGYIF